MGHTRKSANEVELTMMLEICSFHEEMADVELLTMIPEDIIEVQNGLSDTVLAQMPRLLNRTLLMLQEEGIELKAHTSVRSFDAVIDACANPVSPRIF